MTVFRASVIVLIQFYCVVVIPSNRLGYIFRKLILDQSTEHHEILHTLQLHPTKMEEFT